MLITDNAKNVTCKQTLVHFYIKGVGVQKKNKFFLGLKIINYTGSYPQPVQLLEAPDCSEQIFFLRR